MKYNTDTVMKKCYSGERHTYPASAEGAKKMTDKERKAQIKLVYEARRDRLINPEGKFDNAGRWYPSAREDAGDVIGQVRSPSRAYPYSYMQRARTRKHVAVLADVQPEYFAQLVREAEAAMSRVGTAELAIA
jgi:hypothetical protein